MAPIIFNTPKGCRLKHVAAETKNHKSSLVITLTGDEMSLAAAQGQLEMQTRKDELGFMLVERDAKTKTLKITTAAEPEHLNEPPEEKSAAVLEAIFDITGCWLGHIHLHPEAVPLPISKDKMHYSMAVRIEPLEDPRDRNNLAGKYSMAIIRRKQEKTLANGCGPSQSDLQTNTVLLMKLDKEYETSKEALHHAAEMISTLTSRFSIYKPKPVELKLLGIHNQEINYSMASFTNTDPATAKLWSKTTSCYTTATLTGDEKALKKAFKLLKGAFPQNVFNEKFNHGNLEITFEGDKNYDPALFIQRVHRTTHCALPVKIVAGVQETSNDRFNPSLSAVLSSDVPAKDQVSTAHALAGYVALDVPVSHEIIISRHRDGDQSPLIVMSSSHPTRSAALEYAQGMRDQVVANFNGKTGLQPG